MGKQDQADDSYNISESGNWNNAKEYSREKIMKPLVFVDIYRDVAIFGYSSFLDELQSPIPTEMLRIKGFERLVQELIKVTDNAEFAIKKKPDVDIVVGLRKQLQSVLPLIPKLTKKIVTNRGTSTMIKLDEENYTKALNLVLGIARKLNQPLNRNSLIFNDKEEFDPKAFKKGLKKRIIEQG